MPQLALSSEADDAIPRDPEAAALLDRVTALEARARGYGRPQVEEEDDVSDSDSIEYIDADADEEYTSESEPKHDPLAPTVEGSKKNLLKRGSLNRCERAGCRILWAYGTSISVLAARYHRNPDYIKRVTQNKSSHPDNVDKDYDYVDKGMRTMYPPKTDPTCKKRRHSDPDSHVPKHFRPTALSGNDPTSIPATKAVHASSIASASGSHSVSFQAVDPNIRYPHLHSKPTPRKDAGILRRDLRAKCRILSNHGISAQRLATRYNKNVSYIQGVIENTRKPKDDVDEDYEHVDEKTKAKYPSKLRPQLNGSKTKIPSGSISYAIHVDIPPAASTSDDASDKYADLSTFLASLSPPLSRLFDVLKGQNFDNDLMRDLLTWSIEDTEGLLKDLREAGILTPTDSFLIKKGLKINRESGGRVLKCGLILGELP